jgi:pyrroloquinoline quinone biosynthesis protein B
VTGPLARGAWALAAVLACWPVSLPAGCTARARAPTPAAAPPSGQVARDAPGLVAASDGPATDAVLSDLRAARPEVEGFLGVRLLEDVRVQVLPGRDAFSAALPPAWGLGRTACWMVASAVADRMFVLSPRAWRTDACEHDPDDAVHVRRLLAHELVHALHGQHNPTRDFTGLDDLGWFIEGLAVYASGQLDGTRLAETRAAVADGHAPARLAEAWSGRWRYGIAGSLVAFADRRVGRAGLARMLAATSQDALLAELGLAEQELLDAWAAWLAAPGPYALVLGTAQDGGLPQIGCERPCCEAARADPGRRRLVASLLIVDPGSGRRWLIDATPDLAEQVELARGHPPARRAGAAALADAAEGAGSAVGGVGAVGARGAGGPDVLADRPPLFDGLFLTHAHMGHVAGLLQLGREAYAARGVPVHGSERMVRWLGGNQPWSLLVDDGVLRPRALLPGATVALADGLSVTALAVPHRDELTDTLAYLVRGPERTLLYLPDVDAWDAWDRPLEELLADADVALVDGTFFADGELPGRSLAAIPHPFVSDTLARLREQPAALRAKVLFTHLNHSNPAADPASAAAAHVAEAGMAVAEEGQRIGL